MTLSCDHSEDVALQCTSPTSSSNGGGGGGGGGGVGELIVTYHNDPPLVLVHDSCASLSKLIFFKACYVHTPLCSIF